MVAVGTSEAKNYLNTAYAALDHPTLRKLAEKYPELLEEVQKAWVGGTFKELIRMGILVIDR